MVFLKLNPGVAPFVPRNPTTITTTTTNHIIVPEPIPAVQISTCVTPFVYVCTVCLPNRKFSVFQDYEEHCYGESHKCAPEVYAMVSNSFFKTPPARHDADGKFFLNPKARKFIPSEPWLGVNTEPTYHLVLQPRLPPSPSYEARYDAWDGRYTCPCKPNREFRTESNLRQHCNDMKHRSPALEAAWFHRFGTDPMEKVVPPAIPQEHDLYTYYTEQVPMTTPTYSPSYNVAVDGYCGPDGTTYFGQKAVDLQNLVVAGGDPMEIIRADRSKGTSNAGSEKSVEANAEKPVTEDSEEVDDQVKLHDQEKSQATEHQQATPVAGDMVEDNLEFISGNRFNLTRESDYNYYPDMSYYDDQIPFGNYPEHYDANNYYAPPPYSPPVMQTMPHKEFGVRPTYPREHCGPMRSNNAGNMFINSSSHNIDDKFNHNVPSINAIDDNGGQRKKKNKNNWVPPHIYRMQKRQKQQAGNANIASGNTGETAHRCFICNKGFKTSTNLQNHCRDKHEGGHYEHRLSKSLNEEKIPVEYAAPKAIEI